MIPNRYYWRIDDGRFWGFQESRWIEESEMPEGEVIQDLYDSGQPASEEYLRETIRFYGGDPDETPVTRAKREKKAAIDANTDRIRARDGKEFNGGTFDMRDGAKANWSDLAILAARGKIKYPKVILTKDDQPFTIKAESEMDAFLAMVESYFTDDPASPIVTGRMLRMRVEAAQTIEGIEAIVDDRE